MTNELEREKHTLFYKFSPHINVDTNRTVLV
jgi:hypothetical protein